MIIFGVSLFFWDFFTFAKIIHDFAFHLQKWFTVKFKVLNFRFFFSLKQKVLFLPTFGQIFIQNNKLNVESTFNFFLSVMKIWWQIINIMYIFA